RRNRGSEPHAGEDRDHGRGGDAVGEVGMKLRGLVLLMLASLMSIGASRPMNTLVVRHAGAVVPTECEQGIANVPLSPRINVAEIPLPPEPGVAPPRGSLRDALRETQAALTRNDRAAFDAALA